MMSRAFDLFLYNVCGLYAFVVTETILCKIILRGCKVLLK